jgi:hypothetical protein
MKDLETITAASGIPLNAHPPIALDKYLAESGISPVTAWRYRRKGWLKTINICGRHYLTRDAIAEFNRRAQAGEFSKLPRRPGTKSGT